MLMEIVNLTKHPITIYDDSMNLLKVIPMWPRLHLPTNNPVVVDTIDGVPVVEIQYLQWGYIDAVAPVKEWTIYVTSTIVCQSCPDRWDFYIPVNVVKKWLEIVGCRAISVNPYFISYSKANDRNTTDSSSD